jgi:NFACT N-terminal and middle domains/NFACT protein RNA binding domain
LTARDRHPMIPPVNGLTAYALGFELDEALRGALIRRVARFTSGITLDLEGAPFRYWHILFHRPESELIPSPRTIASPRNSIEEASLIRGSRISRVRSLLLERILIFDLVSETMWAEKGKLYARIELTPAVKPLSIFQGEKMKPSDSIGAKNAKKPASLYQIPPQKPLSLLSLPECPPTELAEERPPTSPLPSSPIHLQMREKMRRAAAACTSSVAGVDPILAGALSSEADGEIEKMWSLLLEIGRLLRRRNWKWHTYRFPEGGESGKSAVYPIELPIRARGVPAKNFVEALDHRGAESVLPAYVEHLKRKASLGAAKELKKLERLRENLSADLSEAEKAKEYRHLGNLLVTYRHMLRTGMSEVSVRDFSGDRTLTIPLEPAQTPDRNIRSYFMKARKGEKGSAIIRSRKREAEKAIEKKRRSIAAVSDIEIPDEILSLIPKESARQAAASKDERRLRSYALDERHTAYVGRNDEENDFLTHRFAAPSDLWLHAQNAAGSHVILKGANRSTPKSVIERAASIAAYFSKARHSSTVPVIYAEKRYVRKPRKSKPGVAHCLRAKTILVEPLPPGNGKLV